MSDSQQQAIAYAKSTRLALAGDALNRLEGKLREAEGAIFGAEKALWAAGLERLEVEHRMQSDVDAQSLNACMADRTDRQKLVEILGRIGDQLKAVESTRQLVTAERNAYSNMLGVA